MTNDLQRAQQAGTAPWDDVAFVTKDYVAFNDKYPVTPGHMLFVPKTNSAECIASCTRAALELGNQNVSSEATDITGYNIGINVGKSAGQTVMYPHVHLIFRRNNDTEDPTGGVRNVIPGKGRYS